MHVRPGFAVLGALLFLAACGGDPVAGGSCVTNRDCTSEEMCVAGKCQPASTPGCTSDDGCGSNEYCDLTTSTCKPVEVVACTSDTQCAADQKCNTLTGVCVTGARSCTSEAQCVGISKHCDLSIQQCRGCTNAGHCTGGQVCVEGSCTTPATGSCTTDANCTPPATICESGMCKPGCGDPQTSLVCGSGTSCNATTGRCSATPAGCTTDAACGTNNVCENSRCIPNCTQIGGLSCTGGMTCDSATGRCKTAQACTQDFQCNAPTTVCEGGACVKGCGQTGGLACAGGEVCDNQTGRCEPTAGACSRDAQCAPPTTICEATQCVPGCDEPGGIVCSGTTQCDPFSGRCEPSGGVCFDDTDCNAPSEICDFGDCVPGCATTGCLPTEVCSASTGHCQTNTQPGNGQLGSACAGDQDCASGVCFDFEGVANPACVSACGKPTDCPTGFTCYDFTGGKMCLSAALFGGANFSGQSGSTCSYWGDCRSGYCPGGSCVDTCTTTTDCGASQCGFRASSAGDFYVASCEGQIGGVANGTACGDDTECRSGVCESGTCGGLCDSSTDCADGRTCYPVVRYSSNFDPFFVKSCLESPHGTTPVGGPCTTWETCRSALCHTGVSQCVDVCSTDADCPGTHKCAVEVFGSSATTTAYFTICMPR